MNMRIKTDDFEYLNNNHILRYLTLIPSDDNYCALLINVK